MSRSIYIPEQWYPIEEARKVTRSKPHRIKRLGMELVLWRGTDNKVRVHHAACPHRGADLGLGTINKERGCIVCPYHGFEFHEGGHCTHMPCEGKGAKIRKDLKLELFQVREEQDLIWLWYGDTEPTEELPFFKDRNLEEKRTEAITTFAWPVSFTRVIEGMLDIHHLPFAHGKYVWGVGPLLDPYEATIEKGCIVQSKGTLRYPEKESGFTTELDLYFPGMLYLKLGESVYAGVYMCPVDEQNTWGYISYHQTSLTLPWVGKWFTRVMLWFEMTFVQHDDRRLLLSSEPQMVDIRDDRLVHADKAIALWYKLRAQALESAQKTDG